MPRRIERSHRKRRSDGREIAHKAGVIRLAPLGAMETKPSHVKARIDLSLIFAGNHKFARLYQTAYALLTCHGHLFSPLRGCTSARAPKLSAPQLLEIHSEVFDPVSFKAVIRFSALPESPKPPGHQHHPVKAQPLPALPSRQSKALPVMPE